MGSSDHDCIIFKFNCYTTCTDHKEVPCKLNFWKGNYLAICEELDKVDWNNVLQNNCIDTNWDLFKNRVLTIANKHIPKVRKKPESNKPPWWSKSLSKVVKEKQNLYLQYKFTLSQVDYAKYTSKRNQVKHMIRSAQVQYDESLIQKLSSNPNALYGYVRDKSKVKSKIGQLERSDGTLTTGDEETVEVLNNFFKSVFTNEDPSVIPSFTTRVSTTLSDICITEAEVYDKLVLLNVNKAPGPDGLHSQILKNCASSLARPLCLLFTQSLNSGVLPKEWKQANVTPIFKKGSKSKASNYRPISLTSQPVKILESIIRSKILQYLSDNSVITHGQHGFVSKKSCFTNLLETFEDWTLAVDLGYGIDVIYLDYSKAFDSVPHLRLIEKLAGYGFSGKLCCHG